MPDEDGNTSGEPTQTPLHAYERGREEDIEGEAAGKADKLEDEPGATSTPQND
jgi:hypothetical protein